MTDTDTEVLRKLHHIREELDRIKKIAADGGNKKLSGHIDRIGGLVVEVTQMWPTRTNTHQPNYYYDLCAQKSRMDMLESKLDNHIASCQNQVVPPYYVHPHSFR